MKKKREPKKPIKLNRKMGLELTFETKRTYKNLEREDRLLENKLKELKGKGYRGYVDGDRCLEINSPVFEYVEDALNFWDKLIRDLGKDMVTRRKDSTGGGLHIHVDQSKVSCKKKDIVFSANILKYIRSRPWLTWAFQDPSDDNTSLPLIYDENLFMKLSNQINDRENFQKSYAASLRNINGRRTVELRFFDTCDTREDLRNSLLIANFICQQVDEKAPSGDLEIDYQSSLNRLIPFMALCGVSLEYWIKSIDRMDQKFLWGLEIPEFFKMTETFFVHVDESLEIDEKKLFKDKMKVLGDLARNNIFELPFSELKKEGVVETLRKFKEVFLIHIIATGIHYGAKVKKVGKNEKEKKDAKGRLLQRESSDKWFSYTQDGQEFLINL